jgi:hypothetical protein
METAKSLNTSADELDRQLIFFDEAFKSLEEERRVATDQSKIEIESAISSFENQYKTMINIKKSLDTTHQQLDSLEGDFSHLAEEHDLQWIDYRTQALSQLHTDLAKLLQSSGLPDLPQGEVDNLLRQDNFHELLARFSDLGASKELTPTEREKILGLNDPSYETYFKLKSYLAIRSVHPSREDMGKYLKKLDSFFDQSHQEGQALTERQEVEIKALDQNKVQPILTGTKTNLITLSKLETEREAALALVASSVDIAAINQNVRVRISEIKPRVETTYQIKEVSPGKN